MTVMIPGNVKVYDSTSSLFDKVTFTIFKASTPDTKIVAFKTKVAVLDEYNTESEKEREISSVLREFRKENTKNEDNFFTWEDTIIGKMQCKKVEMLPTTDSSKTAIYAYIAFIDRKLYGVAYHSLTDQSGKDIESLLKGIEFSDDAVEKEENLRYKGVKQKDLLMVLGLTALIVLIVVFVVKSKKKPKKGRRAL